MIDENTNTAAATEESAVAENTVPASVKKINKEPKNLKDISKALKEMGMSASTYVKTRIETYKSADGKTNKTDYYVEREKDGLTILKKLIQAEKSKSKRPQQWNFATVPCKQFGKTLDDVFLAFLKWSTVHEEGADGSDIIADSDTINVSKAFRRLTSYANWMDNRRCDLIYHLETQDIQKTWNAWSMKFSHDKIGRLVWWMDIGQADMVAIKEMRPVETLRLFVWMAHCAMLDNKAQTNGMIYCQNMANIGIFESMKMVSPRLQVKLDKLTFGVLPIKMKNVYVVESPMWIKALLGMMKPFLSKKMNSRIVILSKDSSPGEASTAQVNTVMQLESELGLECIPKALVDLKMAN